MLLWLKGVDNEKGAERELRARADGAVHARRRTAALHRARRPRAGARADRLAQRLEPTTSARSNFRFDTKRHDTGSKTIFGKRGSFDWRDSCRLCVQHPQHPSFFVTKLWSYFIPTPPEGRDAARARAPVRHERLRDRPVVEAILAHPALYTGPRMVKPPVVYTAGLLRGLGRGIDTEAWAWLSEPRGPAALLPAERRRLGRHALARHGDLPRPLGDRRLRAAADTLARRTATKHVPHEADALVARARRSRAPDADSRRPTHDRCSTSPGARSPTPHDKLEEGRLPAAARERAAPADRLRPRPPDLLTDDSCHHCDEFTRLTLLRRSAAEAGRGLPAIEPGMPTPAGTGLDRRSFVAGARPRARRLRARQARASSRRASRRPPRPGAARARVGLPAAASTRSRSSPGGRPERTASCARRSRSPDDAGPAFAEDTRLHWHPPLRRSPRCTARARSP